MGKVFVIIIFDYKWMNITFKFFVKKQPWELKKLHFGFYYNNRICIQVKQYNLCTIGIPINLP